MSDVVDEKQEMDEHYCCPECGSANVIGKIAQDRYRQAHYVNVCLDCHFDWEEVSE